jgi:hypothetical protein
MRLRPRFDDLDHTVGIELEHPPLCPEGRRPIGRVVDLSRNQKNGTAVRWEARGRDPGLILGTAVPYCQRARPTNKLSRSSRLSLETAR